MLHAVFQPHLFSRTRDLAEDFGRALLAADRVVVTDVYPSREQPIAGVTGELVAQAARAQRATRSVDYCPDWRDAAALLAERAARATWCSPSAPATSTGWPRSWWRRGGAR